jgi:hypothetical protein
MISPYNEGGVRMSRTIAIGIQDFEDIIKNDYFYIDKTDFIKEWWESGDSVTLITRPRRFGKTLNMSMVEHFFSNKHEDSGKIFQKLSIWSDEKFRKLQGTYPVISLSFANVKEKSYQQTKERIYQILTDLYSKNVFLLEGDLLTGKEKDYFNSINTNMNETTATMAIHQLSNFLSRYYNRKVIILLDEYDTPMQEAYINGFWDDLISFTRSMFNSTFKTNPYMERAIMTGITRVSKESIFSDLNNLEVVTTTSDKYATAFGFTEPEVFNALDEYGIDDKGKVKEWYDGFVFGHFKDIYNPWSITNLLDTGKFAMYWANSSGNGLVGKLIREGNADIKECFSNLLKGKCIQCTLDEQIVYNQLDDNESAIWSLLLAGGYLKVVNVVCEEDLYELALTNYEVKRMFNSMVTGWFAGTKSNYNEFIKALLRGDRKSMNGYMNRVALATISYFDSGSHPSDEAPERFYHGFVLGLMVDLQNRYRITSNRESGFGRYDVLLEPLNEEDDGIILEFKVYDEDDEKSLNDTVAAALAQIDKQHYEQALVDRGISKSRIRKYGFAFKGKKVLIG